MTATVHNKAATDPSQRLLLVNYHYVREPGAYPHPGIHPIAPEKFRRQIDKLSRHCRIVSPEVAEAFVLEGAPLSGPSALLTFDDGLVDHAWTARNILDPQGIRAMFFVCSRPLRENRALVVHKVHYLRATTPPARFRHELLDALPDDWRARGLTSDEKAAAARTYIYDQIPDAEIKYLVNFVLPEEAVDVATGRMLEARGIGEEAFCRETYMDSSDLRGMDDAGHRIEAHTHDHRPVTRLGRDEDHHMALNVETIATATGRRPRWISFPFGRDWALPADPAGFCRRHGFSVGVTLTGNWVEPGTSAFALERINTNEVDDVLSHGHVAGG